MWEVVPCTACPHTHVYCCRERAPLGDVTARGIEGVDLLGPCRDFFVTVSCQCLLVVKMII